MTYSICVIQLKDKSKIFKRRYDIMLHHSNGVVISDSNVRFRKVSCDPCPEYIIIYCYN